MKYKTILPFLEPKMFPKKILVLDLNGNGTKELKFEATIVKYIQFSDGNQKKKMNGSEKGLIIPIKTIVTIFLFMFAFLFSYENCLFRLDIFWANISIPFFQLKCQKI